VPCGNADRFLRFISRPCAELSLARALKSFAAKLRVARLERSLAQLADHELAV
jgi:hypothetical protein